MQLEAIKVNSRLLKVVGYEFELNRFFESEYFIVNNSKEAVRTALQNNAFHGDCSIIAGYTGYTPAQIKVMIKDKFSEYFPFEEIVNPETGVIHQIQKGTKDLGKRKFAKFTEEYRAWFEMKLGEIRWYQRKDNWDKI